MNRRARFWAAVTVSILFALVTAGTAGRAVAHTDRPDEPAGGGHDTTPTEPAASEPDGAEHPESAPAELPSEVSGARLELHASAAAAVGEKLELEATLRDSAGQPIEGAALTFFRVTGWGGWLEGAAVLGRTVTDQDGVAKLGIEARSSGDVKIGVRFDGNETASPVQSVPTEVKMSGDRQLYAPDVGLDLPGPSTLWLLLAVAAVWGIYAFVASITIGIARAGDRAPTVPAKEHADGRVGRPEPRRNFLRYLLPIGLTAGVASLGSGLVVLLARSPRTHDSLTSSGTNPRGGGTGHALTPIVRLGQKVELRPLPPLLDRAVSFADEVLPILRAKGGPHAITPKNSPVPNGVSFGSYENLMVSSEQATDHGDDHGALLVPGNPMASRLVTVLLDPSMQMPPSVPPLPDREIQIVATWVAQGAQNN